MNQATDLSNGVAAAGVVVLGVATGLSYDVLLAGFAGGLVSLSFIEPLGIWRRIWTIMTATLTAGYTAPAALPWLTKVSPEGAEIPLVFAGFFVGVFGQALIPWGINLMRRWMGGFHPTQEK